jgi:hypothetical protein
MPIDENTSFAEIALKLAQEADASGKNENIKTIEQYSSPTTEWDEFEEFARFMKNDYIAELDGEAKKYCIEVSKVLKK